MYIGYTSVIPHGIFSEVDDKELFHYFQITISHLTDQPVKQKVAEYIFLRSDLHNSGALCNFRIPCRLMWFLDNNIFSAKLYSLLCQNQPTPSTLSLISKAIDVADDDSSTVLLENYGLKFDQKDAHKLISKAVTTGKVKATCHLMKVTQLYDSLRNVYEQFDMNQFELFALHSTPQMKRELLNIMLYSGSHEKRYTYIGIITQSGEIDVCNNLDFKKIVVESLPFLLEHPITLQKLFKAGFHITHKREIIKIVLQNDCKGIFSNRVKLICILLENGASVESLKYACSHKQGTFIEGATELAVKTG